MKKRLFGLGFAFLLFMGTAPLSANSTTAPKNLPSKIGKKLSLTGLAENAKLGAVLMVNHEPIYLKDMSAWPEPDLHQIVRVTGILRQVQQPMATQEGGIWSAGVAAPGNAYQLEQYQTERVKLGY